MNRFPTREARANDSRRILERAQQGATRDLQRIKFNGPLFKALPEFDIRSHTTDAVLTAWPAANRSFYIPFLVEQAFVTACRFSVLTGTGTAGHNISLGLYKVEEDRNTVSIFGGVSSVGLLAAQPHSIVYTELSFSEGTYYAAVSLDSAVPQILAFDRTCLGTHATMIGNLGIRSYASEYPLPGTSFSLLDGNGSPVYSYIPAIALRFGRS